jgi:hypothetical protein
LYPKQNIFCLNVINVWINNYLPIFLHITIKNNLHILTLVSDTGRFPVVSLRAYRWMTYVQYQQTKGQRGERLTVHFQEQAGVLFQINDAQRTVFCNMLHGTSTVKLCFMTINKLYTAETFDRHLQDTLNTIFTCSILSSVRVFLHCDIDLQAINI